MKQIDLYLDHILECIERIELYTQKGEQAFLNDIQIQDAVYRNFEIMGEASKRVPDTLKIEYPQIPWKDIAGFRDVLIHQYDGVDPVEVWVAIAEHLPMFKKNLLIIIQNRH
jgi:uncharacterized protein with HEPN domain